LGTPAHPFDSTILVALARADIAAHGVFSLEQGFLLSSMLWGALTVEVIERRFTRAAVWAWAGAALSACGMIHSYRFAVSDTVQSFSLLQARPFVISYVLLGLLLASGRWLVEDVSHE